jgi:hypothetical protein
MPPWNAGLYRGPPLSVNNWVGNTRAVWQVPVEARRWLQEGQAALQLPGALDRGMRQAGRQACVRGCSAGQDA